MTHALNCVEGVNYTDPLSLAPFNRQARAGRGARREPCDATRQGWPRVRVMGQQQHPNQHAGWVSILCVLDLMRASYVSYGVDLVYRIKIYLHITKDTGPA